MSKNEMEDATAIPQMQDVHDCLDVEGSRGIENEDQNRQRANVDPHIVDRGTALNEVAVTKNLVVADKNDNFGARQSKARKQRRLNKGSIGNTKGNQKVKMRAPQQPAMTRKLSNKSYKAHVKSCKQAIKAELENLYNAKNQNSHRKNHAANKTIQNYSKMLGNRAAAQFALRSKFFLPAKRPRKEVIVPPTKFLLGGNISDPLNLNGLQNESQNPTPNQTPQQSPVTTPPKVEVIIPPNIFDPLHLLDPVDSVEYEKQLVSPMKRKTKPKHRHRKKKTKRKSATESIPDVSSAEQPITTTIGGACFSSCSAPTFTMVCAPPSTDISGVEESYEIGKSDIDDSESVTSGKEQHFFPVDVAEMKSGGDRLELNESKPSGSHEETSKVETSGKPTVDIPNTFSAARFIEKGKSRELKLDLSDLGGDHHSVVSGGGRKRRISEGPKQCNKFRKMDAMDKIVSPVVPQPGAWKRPPRTKPSGGRKGSRLRSTSVSGNELISPTDETKSFECDSNRGDTPEIDAQKHFTESEARRGSSAPPSKNLESEVQQQRNNLPKFRADGYRYQYGNFDRYSGYRNINEIMDVRLEVFHRNANLFRGKDILDVGCNAGHIAIAVAKDLAPKSVLGIDIDKNLITRARRNLSMFVRIPKDNAKVVRTKSDEGSKEHKSEDKMNELNVQSEACASQTANDLGETADVNHAKDINSRKKNTNRRRQHHGKGDRGKIEFFPISFPITYGVLNEVSTYTKKDTTSPVQTSHEDRQFPKNVYFRTSNYVLKDESLINNETQQYDVILCLSVTKWIHLNFGDAGLKQAFKRMFNQLRPGGKLILEAQNWASYKKKKNLTETIYNNYRNIEFFPNRFHEYLLGNEVGFSHSYCLGVPRHMNKGFCRPIQLYAKGDYTPNHIRWSDNYHPQTPYEAYRGIYAGTSRSRYPIWGPLDTPRGNSGSYSCRQTPVHPELATSQYYNPMESDSYLPSYDTEVQNRHYVFASPLYQTVWSPPASLRNSSNKTPVFGSIREADSDENISRHVYPPNDFATSPQAGSAFNSIRELDLDDTTQQAQSGRPHVYAHCEDTSSNDVDNSSSPRNHNSSSSPNAVGNSSQSMDQVDSNDDMESDVTANAENMDINQI